MTLLLTGGSGFVGHALVRSLAGRGEDLVCPVRPGAWDRHLDEMPNIRQVYIPGIDGKTDWQKMIEGVSTVVHLAGMAHVRTRHRLDLYDQFLRVNYAGTLNLAFQAAKAGVKRFVFLSTIGVNGPSNTGRQPFKSEDFPAPENAYALTKLKAEQGLRRVEARTGMAVVILRPPLVYGPHVKGNFLRLMNLVRLGMPLPLANADNQKSMVGLENLVDALDACIRHENASGRTFLVRDAQMISTRDLVQRIAGTMGKRPVLFPLPRTLVKKICKGMGRKRIYDQLWGDLRMDSRPIRELLLWTPKNSQDRGIEQTVQWYMNTWAGPCD